MLRIDAGARKLVRADDGSLTAEAIRERAELQGFIVNSWDDFVAEIGAPDLMRVGAEVQPHTSCANRIDILAFDSAQARPVVIELKRQRDRLQLLQALSYAGMLSSWSTERYLQLLDEDGDEDLRNSLQNRDTKLSPAVMLIAEQFDPEVMLTAEWLASEHGVDISCFSMKVFKLGEETHMLIQRDFPLRGIDDLYVARRQPGVPTGNGDQTWSDVKTWIDFDWGEGAISEMLATTANNSAAKRYFATPYQGEWGGYMMYVQKRELKVRFHSRRDGDVAYWVDRLPEASVGEWGNADTAQGISISLPTRAAFDAFIEGLQALPPGGTPPTTDDA